MRSWEEPRGEETEEGGGLLSRNFLLVSSLPLKCHWEMKDWSFTAASPPYWFPLPPPLLSTPLSSVFLLFSTDGSSIYDLFTPFTYSVHILLTLLMTSHFFHAPFGSMPRLLCLLLSFLLSLLFHFLLCFHVLNFYVSHILNLLSGSLPLSLSLPPPAILLSAKI